MSLHGESGCPSCATCSLGRDPIARPLVVGLGTLDAASL
jgi:hypothetical protein